jgi:protein-S-isoprenylcysteine O-methyltransferase Ste14
MPDTTTPHSIAAGVIAWTGAALFLVSLLWFGYQYLSGFDRLPARLPLFGAITCDVALFSIFALHHSLLARTGGKRLVQRLASPKLERSIYTWTASLLFIGVCTFWQHVPGVVYVLPGPWRVAGYAVQFAGLVLTIRSSGRLGVLDLAGVRQATGAPGRRPSLETDGVYGFVRHPLYFAWALMVFGAPSMTATRATFAIVSTGYLALAIPWEERSLVAAFGAQYDSYRRHVRWRMIPGVY